MSYEARSLGIKMVNGRKFSVLDCRTRALCVSRHSEVPSTLYTRERIVRVGHQKMVNLTKHTAKIIGNCLCS